MSLQDFYEQYWHLDQEISFHSHLCAGSFLLSVALAVIALVSLLAAVIDPFPYSKRDIRKTIFGMDRTIFVCFIIFLIVGILAILAGIQAVFSFIRLGIATYHRSEASRLIEQAIINMGNGVITH